jgi:hypothetical protein
MEMKFDYITFTQIRVRVHIYNFNIIYMYTYMIDIGQSVRVKSHYIELDRKLDLGIIFRDTYLTID